jgi:hypothetical protein
MARLVREISRETVAPLLERAGRLDLADGAKARDVVVRGGARPLPPGY